MPPPPQAVAKGGGITWWRDRRTDGGRGTKLPTHPKPSHNFLATRRAEAAAAAAAAQRGPDTGGTGIALSGGGNRAYTCSFGVLRGLAVKGALDNPPEKQWMSGASGGGWATATYSFNQTVPRDVLLDVGRAALSPSELTVEACSTVEPRSMGQPVSTKPMTYCSILLSFPLSCIASSLALQPFGAISWIRNVWRVYLAPFGVPQGKLFAASAAEVDAKGGRRDDYLFPAKYCASTPLIGITMYGPSVAQLGPIPACTLPGCIGMSLAKDFVRNINAADVAAATIDGPSPEEARAKHDNHAPVQYVVSPSEVATGYSGPPAEVSGLACISETIDIGHVPGVHPSEWSQGFGKANSLEFYLGAGSMMEAASLSSKQFSLMGRIENAALEALMPTARFETNVGVWNTLKLGDGGNLDNTASLTLLRRQCKEVLVLMSSGTPFCSKCSNEESQPRSSHRHFASPTHLAAPAPSSLEGSTLTRQLVR